MRVVKFLFLIFVLAGGSALAASQSASVSVDTKLYTAADVNSKVVTELAQGAKVTIEQRKGAWYQIKNTQGKTGWVRSYDVQRQASSSWFSRLKRVIAGGTASQSNASATIGIRGLGPGDVKKAEPDPKELAKLDGFKQTLADGKKYAASVPLTTKQVSYLAPITQTAEKKTSQETPKTNTNEKALDDVGKGIKDVGKALKGLF